MGCASGRSVSNAPAAMRCFTSATESFAAGRVWACGIRHSKSGPERSNCAVIDSHLNMTQSSANRRRTSPVLGNFKRVPIFQVMCADAVLDSGNSPREDDFESARCRRYECVIANRNPPSRPGARARARGATDPAIASPNDCALSWVMGLMPDPFSWWPIELPEPSQGAVQVKMPALQDSREISIALGFQWKTDSGTPRAQAGEAGGKRP